MYKVNHPLEQKYRYVLFPLALFYWGVIFWRNLFYQIRFFVTHKLPCKVISVGNLTAGGAGKTPLVITLARLLQRYGQAVAILSRGYGRTTTGTVLVTDGETIKNDWQAYGDEPALMAKILKGIPIAVDENRYRGGLFLSHRFNPDIILLDDAFQHRLLERDLDIVLINSGDNRQDHKLLPYGLLREPWIHLRRAHLVVLTKTNLKPPAAFLKARLRHLPIPWFSSTIIIGTNLYNINNSQLSVKALAGKKVLAVSGVADPTGFVRTIKQTGAEVVGTHNFPDHFHYTAKELNLLEKERCETGADLIITTEKDMIKFAILRQNRLPLYALPIEAQLSPEGEKAVIDVIMN